MSAAYALADARFNPEGRTAPAFSTNSLFALAGKVRIVGVISSNFHLVD